MGLYIMNFSISYVIDTHIIDNVFRNSPVNIQHLNLAIADIHRA